MATVAFSLATASSSLAYYRQWSGSLNGGAPIRAAGGECSGRLSTLDASHHQRTTLSRLWWTIAIRPPTVIPSAHRSRYA